MKKVIDWIFLRVFGAVIFVLAFMFADSFRIAIEQLLSAKRFAEWYKANVINTEPLSKSRDNGK